MEFESYIRNEVVELISEPDKLEEWKQQIDQLQLEGQSSLLKNNKSPIPFPIMNKEEYRIYNNLFNNKVKVESYKEETLSNDVLKLVALAKTENYFRYMEVWYSKEIPDPILVGVTYPEDNTWDRTFYLMARWGDVLLDLPSLKKKVAESIAKQVKVEIDEFDLKFQAFKKNQKDYVDLFFDGKDVNIPSLDIRGLRSW